jgi:CRISPR-associated protein Cmr4
MKAEVKPFFIKVITPLHAGSGSDLGVVDLPIQRESHTSFPKIEASSLKGSIRKAFEDSCTSDEDKKKIHIAFGCDGCEKDGFKDDEKDFAGALGFSDAKILFFPVKSVKGVFAYITCPFVLNRFNEEHGLLTKELQDIFEVPRVDVNDENCIVLGEKNKIGNNVILEEYSFSVQETETTEFIKIPNLDIDKERIIIISDDNFTHFVKNSTEVITRTKIDNTTGTVQAGALFTEEYLPAQSVMYSLVIANKPFSQKIDNFDTMNFFNQIPKNIQIGGNSTLGKGIVEISCEGCKDECK